jgi:hypothetical protein
METCVLDQQSVVKTRRINNIMDQSKDNKMTENQAQTPKEATPDEQGNLSIRGHIKIFDPETKEVIIDKPNAIHYENFSIALAQSASNYGQGWIAEMCFGNGGSRVDPTGIITYLTPNSVGINANLYNQTYKKVIDSNSVNNLDPSRNFMNIRHTTGLPYTDIMISCLLDFGEPANQSAFDNATNYSGNYVFDELGLRAYNSNGAGTGNLLTHVIFHPVQKSLNRMLQIDYTIRIQSLTTITG